ncbi:MAG: hypothetical protein HUJ67_06270, partial [Ruminiclostridium sp.]|nr:hypothetical protein [Ruminiclostridium sp.]
MAGIEVAQAFVTILPSMQGIQGKITDELVPAADRAGGEAGTAAGKSFAKKMQDFGSGAQTVGKTLSKYVTTPILAVGTASGAAAVNFETSMAQLRTIADTTA